MKCSPRRRGHFQVIIAYLYADRGNARTQFYSGFMLAKGESLLMNKSLAVHYYHCAANQGLGAASQYYGDCLLSGIGIERIRQVGIE
jgi:TPR repeat protein